MRTDFPAMILGAMLLILLGGCEEEPDFIGGDLLPTDDQFRVQFDSTAMIFGYTRPADSLRVVDKPLHFLGSLTHPFYGFTRAELASAIGTTTSSDSFGPNARHDSVILQIYAAAFEGTGSAPQKVTLYELKEGLRFDTTYYSSWDVSGKYREEPPLGTAQFLPADSVFRIEITDTAYIKRFMSLPDSVLRTTPYLQDSLDGFYFAVEDASDEGGLFSLNFDDPNARLQFHYHNDLSDGLLQEYSLQNDRAVKINLYSHRREGFPVHPYINHPAENDSLLFFQSLGGLSPVFYFPALEQWQDSMPVAINEVKLRFTLADTLLTGISASDYPASFFVYMIRQDGSLAFPYDYQLDGDGFGGQVQEGEYTFEFTLKAQLQSIAMGDLENLRMLMIPASPYERHSRGAIYGWNADPAKRPRMEIIYTLL